MYCQYCGKELRGEFCGNCGKRNGIAPVKPVQSKPFRKTWGFWVIIGIIVFSIIVTIFGTSPFLDFIFGDAEPYEYYHHSTNLYYEPFIQGLTSMPNVSK